MSSGGFSSPVQKTRHVKAWWDTGKPDVVPCYGIAWRLRNESLREEEYFQWTPQEAFLYVDMGIDKAEYFANWAVV